MLIDSAKKTPRDPEGFYTLGSFYLTYNKFDDALGAFKEAIAIKSDHGPSLENLGLVYYRKQDYDNAITYLNKALKVISETPTLHNTLGAVYRAKKMYAEAIRSHKKAIELDPEYYSAYYNLALVLQDMKSPEASAAWEKYIELASETPSEARFVKSAKNNLENLRQDKKVRKEEY